MFELVLTFVLISSAMEAPHHYDQRVISFESAADCRAALTWWNTHRGAQMPDMDDAWRLLIGPSCRPVQPVS